MGFPFGWGGLPTRLFDECHGRMKHGKIRRIREQVQQFCDVLASTLPLPERCIQIQSVLEKKYSKPHILVTRHSTGTPHDTQQHQTKFATGWDDTLVANPVVREASLEDVQTASFAGQLALLGGLGKGQ